MTTTYVYHDFLPTFDINTQDIEIVEIGDGVYSIEERPPPKFFSPMCISPFKKVPLVSTTARALISSPKEVLTPTQRPPLIKIPVTIS